MPRSDSEQSLSHEDMPPVLVDRTLALTRPPIIKARDYWMTLRGARAMPGRAEIVPRDLREILPHIGLVEMVPLPDGGEDYAMRLVGGKVEEVFGPLTGQPICTALPAETAARWRLVFDEVRASGKPLAVTGRVGFDNQRHLKYELFIAPLGEDGAVRMMFGALDIWPVT
jgi:hypothetical protein